MEAYILVKIATQTEYCGHARTVVEKLKTLKGVENAQLMFGDYDVIIKLKAPKIHDIENLVFENICMIDGIASTNTLLCIDEGIVMSEV